MNCSACGAPLKPGDQFCRSCGMSAAAAPRPSYTINNYAAQSIPSEYRPLSPWAYIGYSFLFSIPLVGLVLLIVFSFNSENLNRRNFARSYWCALLLVIIIVIVLAVTGTLGALIGDLSYRL